MLCKSLAQENNMSTMITPQLRLIQLRLLLFEFILKLALYVFHWTWSNMKNAVAKVKNLCEASILHVHNTTDKTINKCYGHCSKMVFMHRKPEFSPNQNNLTGS
jgi:hypothetical protein